MIVAKTLLSGRVSRGNWELSSELAGRIDVEFSATDGTTLIISSLDAILSRERCADLQFKTLNNYYIIGSALPAAVKTSIKRIKGEY